MTKRPGRVGHAAFSLGQGVTAAFTDRYGGVSAPPYDELNLGVGSEDVPEAVAENRRRAAAALGLDPDRVVWMRQVHGDNVVRVERPFGAAAPGVDGLVTTVPALALAVLAADCAPVLLADPVARVVGVAHAGRPGMARGVVPALMAHMELAGATPSRVVAAIGPAVCGRCYEVPAQMREEVAARVPAAWCTTRKGTPGLDVRRGIVSQLRQAGVDRVTQDPRCTMESPDMYSYRRNGRTGRFAGFLWLDPEP